MNKLYKVEKQTNGQIDKRFLTSFYIHSVSSDLMRTQDHAKLRQINWSNLFEDQVPHTIIGISRLLYHIKALSVVIRTTLKNFQMSRKSGLIFLIFGRNLWNKIEKKYMQRIDIQRFSLMARMKKHFNGEPKVLAAHPNILIRNSRSKAAWSLISNKWFQNTNEKLTRLSHALFCHPTRHFETWRTRSFKIGF